MSERLATGEALPADLLHPDDIIIEKGRFVGTHGGDPIEAAKIWAKAIRMKDLYLLQAELDRRVYRSDTKIDFEAPAFLSFVYVICLNDALPKRLQLDENDLIWRVCAGRIRKLDLFRQLCDGYAELDMPDATTFPPITTKTLANI